MCNKDIFQSISTEYDNYESYSDSIKIAIQVIHDEYNEKLTLNYLASKIHIHPAYLSRKFQDDVGIGFSEYLNIIRLNIAQKLLVESPELSIQAVSEKCGYNSQHYFSQIFRKLIGKSPREYRIGECSLKKA